MRVLNYIALLLFLLWAVGYLVLNLNELIHLLLFMAIISVLLRIMKEMRYE